MHESGNQSQISSVPMCLIVFAYKYHPEYPFILAGNRDEFHQRPALGIHMWDTDPLIVAGKDKKAGGTWLGVNENGRVAAITNYRDIQSIRENTPSRGEIIPKFLLSGEDTYHTLDHIEKRAGLYNGFNLIAGSIDELYYLSNHGHSLQAVEPGIHVISNAALNTPWPKSEWAKSRFNKLLKSGSLDEESLFDMLKNSDRYPPEQLPDTGLSEEMERAVSSVFILTENYGTRSSALVTIDRSNHLNFTERVYLPGTKITENYKQISLQLKHASAG